MLFLYHNLVVLDIVEPSKCSEATNIHAHANPHPRMSARSPPSRCCAGGVDGQSEVPEGQKLHQTSGKRPSARCTVIWRTSGSSGLDLGDSFRGFRFRQIPPGIDRRTPEEPEKATRSAPRRRWTPLGGPANGGVVTATP